MAVIGWSLSISQETINMVICVSVHDSVYMVLKRGTKGVIYLRRTVVDMETAVWH